MKNYALAFIFALGLSLHVFGPARADPFLDEMVGFEGQMFMVQHKVPALVIAVVRDGEISVKGFGERAGPGSPPPDGDTLMRIGSITKPFTGLVLAHLAAEGKVQFATPLAALAPEFADAKDPNIAKVRLLDLVTHAGGFPREVPHEPGSDGDPFAPITPGAFAAWIKDTPLLFEPGTSVMYSNFGFDLLAIALANAAKKPYPELLKAYVTAPLGMKDTVFEPSEEQRSRLMHGHAPDGEALPVVPTGPVIVGSGGLYSTPNDLMRWMKWHLDRFGKDGAEARILDHALYVPRVGLKTVSGLDHAGHMDAMGLAWVGMMPRDDQPFILQKAGGLQGEFSYIAFAPTRNAAVFVSINKFDFTAGIDIGNFANDLLANIAPR
jgi:D-alanyl-D-alanine-carboxypeptidase/D-alanyl-D-alanine-endopeptidase